MATKMNPGKFDCYENAEPDEPMFVLLARDRHAPALVWLWSALREIGGEDVEKVHEARQCVLDMIEWAHKKGRPVEGLGVSVLAGVMEMIRTINHQMQLVPTNHATTIDDVRLFFCQTKFEPPESEPDCPK